ncbi:hypothetical protein NDU88_001289 [Pleurodeles waltl]|uniref:Uncharacterized protein n=1 Tax=Pleurodeles waltl TaxID=8319 RepID=A0AAV7WLC2_PLEWA|nr:hypothetical protein NDU88_001289 [Pleurodeles waltl]
MWASTWPRPLKGTHLRRQPRERRRPPAARPPAARPMACMSVPTLNSLPPAKHISDRGYAWGALQSAELFETSNMKVEEPVYHTFLEQLFRVLREDFVAPKCEVAMEVKDPKKNMREMGHSLEELENTGGRSK